MPVLHGATSRQRLGEEAEGTQGASQKQSVGSRKSIVWKRARGATCAFVQQRPVSFRIHLTQGL